ncbi:MAG: hypothetical protein ABIM89_15410 [Mycobacteriales bacterium]
MPPLRQYSARRLAERNTAARADVPAETPPPDWTGDCLDLDDAVGVLPVG